MYDIKTTSGARNRLLNLVAVAGPITEGLNNADPVEFAELVRSTCNAVLDEMFPTNDGGTEEQRLALIAEAGRTWGLDENIAVEYDGAVSVGDDPTSGWVQAWVWTSLPEEGGGDE
jgi:hypothetical protein